MRSLAACGWLTLAAGIVFQREGPLHLSEGSYIIKFRVNLGGFHEHCASFNNATLGALRKMSHPTTRFTLNQTIASMNDACERAEYWPSRWSSQRPKRQVGLLLAGAAFGGLLTNLWESATDHSVHVEKQVKRMRGEIEELTRSAAHISDALHANMKLSAQLLALEAFAAATARNIHSLNSISDSLDVLITADRVSPKLIPPSVAAELWSSVALEFSSRLLPQSPLRPTALYELPATYQFAHDILEVGVHLPIIKETFTLYHKKNHPLWLPEHPHPLLVGKEGYLAVAPDLRSFVRLSHNLAGCPKIKTEPVCALASDRTDWDQECLASLFKGAMIRLCEFAPQPPF